MVKIHLFSGFENQRLKIARDTPLGHLYSDDNINELLDAAKTVGVNPDYIQNSRGFYHFDLWGKPLNRARLFYSQADNHILYRDLKIRRQNSKLQDTMD
jgi:hypothetical protein